MDYLSLESALLLQGGEPYYGYGWSSKMDPTSSAMNSLMEDGHLGGYTTSTEASGMNANITAGYGGAISCGGGVGVGGGGIVGNRNRAHNQTVARMPTPLDQLLLYLKREYASSAGPQDVLASVISNDELEFLLNAATVKNVVGNTMNAGGVVIVPAAAAAAAEGKKEVGLSMAMAKDAGGWDDGARAATPLASGGGRSTIERAGINNGEAVASSTATAANATPLYPDGSSSFPTAAQPIISSQFLQNTATNLDISTSKGQQHPPQPPLRRRRMPSFCYAPASHVDNLLQTTPHLRHLSVASTDMSGVGIGESKNFFTQLFSKRNNRGGQSSADPGGSSSASMGISSKGAESTVPSSSTTAFLASGPIDYATSLLRQRATSRASHELASFLRILSDEMPHDKFVAVESEVYSKLFSLVHSKTARGDERLAGVAALDALISVPSSDEEKKAIRFGNNLSHGLKASYADYEFLHAIARALGRMALKAANVDRVEFEIVRCLEWLQTDRSDRRLAAVLVLRELARCAPTAFYSKTHNVNSHHHHAATAAGSSAAGGGIGAGRDGGVGGLAALTGLGGTNEFLDHIL